VTKRFRRLVAQTCLPPQRLHDLRHGRASLLLASGADLAVVSKVLGHSGYAITADTYAHLLEGAGGMPPTPLTRSSRGSHVTNL
jgi:integrase